MKKKIDRRSFFSTLGKGVIITAVASALPTKFISTINRVSKKEKINIVIHPSAVKRTKKV